MVVNMELVFIGTFETFDEAYEFYLRKYNPSEHVWELHDRNDGKLLKVYREVA